MIPTDKQIEEAIGEQLVLRATPREMGFNIAKWMLQQIMDGVSASSHDSICCALSWSTATLAAEARHQEALRVKDAEINLATKAAQAWKPLCDEKDKRIAELEKLIGKAAIESGAFERDQLKITALESRIEKLRGALEYLKNTEMAACNVEECVATISQALANDDKAKEMSK